MNEQESYDLGYREGAEHVRMMKLDGEDGRAYLHNIAPDTCADNVWAIGPMFGARRDGVLPLHWSKGFIAGFWSEMRA